MCCRLVGHATHLTTTKVGGVVSRQCLIFRGYSWQYLWTGIHYKLAIKSFSCAGSVEVLNYLVLVQYLQMSFTNVEQCQKLMNVGVYGHPVHS